MKIEAGNLWSLLTEARARGGCSPAAANARRATEQTPTAMPTAMARENGILEWSVAGEMARFAQ
ncbi:uncharacterized protein TrAtP1_003942 [Trichoderma atroviride]|uniref:uncharacterized protein n=1 Tax=Hypocrea atroviridis TaxID=63577 RepID=UPI0033216F61|nr:hypothetical protein TrAtP1_003942 [Trichoderma atroviride]